MAFTSADKKVHSFYDNRERSGKQANHDLNNVHL